MYAYLRYRYPHEVEKSKILYDAYAILSFYLCICFFHEHKRWGGNVRRKEYFLFSQHSLFTIRNGIYLGNFQAIYFYLHVFPAASCLRDRALNVWIRSLSIQYSVIPRIYVWDSMTMLTLNIIMLEYSNMNEWILNVIFYYFEEWILCATEKTSEMECQKLYNKRIFKIKIIIRVHS